MSVESEIKALRQEVSGLSRKLDCLVSEKALNEDFGYLQAMKEAKKGNRKALKEYFNSKRVS